MKCPKCNGIDLAVARRQGITISACPQCGGVWLEAGALDRMLEQPVNRLTDVRIHRAPLPGYSLPTGSFQVRLRIIAPMLSKPKRHHEDSTI